MYIHVENCFDVLLSTAEKIRMKLPIKVRWNSEISNITSDWFRSEKRSRIIQTRLYPGGKESKLGSMSNSSWTRPCWKNTIPITIQWLTLGTSRDSRSSSTGCDTLEISILLPPNERCSLMSSLLVRISKLSNRQVKIHDMRMEKDLFLHPRT